MRRAEKRRRAVIDTNLIVSGLILKRGNPHELIAAWRRGAFFLVTSPLLQEEYRRVLLRRKFRGNYGLSDEEVEAFLDLVAKNALKIKPQRRLPIQVRDPNDEKVLAAALGNRAGYLVTGDEDLLALRDDPRIKRLRIVTAREFLEVLQAG